MIKLDKNEEQNCWLWTKNEALRHVT